MPATEDDLWAVMSTARWIRRDTDEPVDDETLPPGGGVGSLCTAQ